MAFGEGREQTLWCRLYSGCARPRLWRRAPLLWRRAPLLAALALAVGSGGCSLSYTLDSYLGGAKPDVAQPDVTGSITPPPSGKDTGKAANLPPESDLAYARAAASEVLGRGEKDASLPWENPHSGARGTVTPIASAYQQDGQTCRDFLASYVAGDAQAWLQGEACREKDGWQVRAFKPWQKS